MAGRQKKDGKRKTVRLDLRNYLSINELATSRDLLFDEILNLLLEIALLHQKRKSI
jgi:hypothetical protein